MPRPRLARPNLITARKLDGNYSPLAEAIVSFSKDEAAGHGARFLVAEQIDEVDVVEYLGPELKPFPAR
jgi:hypothetical protein